MNSDFIIPAWFPVPQSVLNACFSLGSHYERITFSSETTDEPAIQIWVHKNRVLSDEEAKKIVYNETGDIAGGYYSIDDKWIPFSTISFSKTSFTEKGETIWKATTGPAAGSHYEVIEKDGNVISHEETGMWIA